jgi:hypothetical protein
LISNWIYDLKKNIKVKKLLNLFNKYKDDSIIGPILLEYTKLKGTGEEEDGGTKQEYYESERLMYLSDKINTRLKELMTDKEYNEFEKYKKFLIDKLKKKFAEENPEEYRKEVNYVPDWDKDNIVDIFLEDVSDYFNQGYKARNWRDSAKRIIEDKWIIENDNIVLEGHSNSIKKKKKKERHSEEEYDDIYDIYIDENTDEFIRDITDGLLDQGYKERNLRGWISSIMKEKGYKVYKK